MLGGHRLAKIHVAEAREYTRTLKDVVQMVATYTLYRRLGGYKISLCEENILYVPVTKGNDFCLHGDNHTRSAPIIP